MTRMRLAIALITAAALVLLFVLVRPGGGDDDKSTATTTGPQVVLTVSKGPPTTPSARSPVWRIDASEGSIARRKVAQADQVALFVTADTSDEVHVHGYDLKADVAPAKPASIRFRADVPGRFEIELEHAGKQIAELTVEP